MINYLREIGRQLLAGWYLFTFLTVSNMTVRVIFGMLLVMVAVVPYSNFYFNVVVAVMASEYLKRYTLNLGIRGWITLALIASLEVVSAIVSSVVFALQGADSIYILKVVSIGITFGMVTGMYYIFRRIRYQQTGRCVHGVLLHGCVISWIGIYLMNLIG